MPGNVLLFPPTPQPQGVKLSGRGVPSALEGLTSVFGMGTGITPPLWSPGKKIKSKSYSLALNKIFFCRFF